MSFTFDVMRHFHFKTAVTLLCFAFGVFSSYFPLAVKSLRNLTQKQISPAGKNVEIRFQELIANESGRVAKFVIENKSTDALRYNSYGKNNHCSYTFSYKIGNDQQISQSLVCLSPGIEEQELLPGETATYLIDVPAEVYNAEKVRAAFEFTVGKERRKEIIWSDEATLPRVKHLKSPLESIISL